MYSLLGISFLIFHFSPKKNKATSYHLGQLKAKLAKLRRELIAPPGGGGGGGGVGFDVARYTPFPDHNCCRLTLYTDGYSLCRFRRVSFCGKGVHAQMQHYF